MKKLVAAGFLFVAGAELIALSARHPQLVPIISGGAVALALLAVRWQLAQGRETDGVRTHSDDAAESLHRWRARTETLVSRADSTRTDWDRHLRPMLARQFEMATGQKRIRDETAYHATGKMLFGAELWQWVNPENVARSGVEQPGPGRAALDEILQRLERI